jgi:hypothetical protein
MIHEPRNPISLAERREVERAVIAEIMETAGQAVDVCPECGEARYDIIQTK